MLKIPLTLSIVNTFDDPANDVLKMKVLQAVDKGNYIDGIDILKLEINNQHVNLTLAGDLELLTETDTRVSADIDFLTSVDNDIEIFFQREYGIKFQINSELFDSDFIFMHYIKFGGGYTHEEWDGDSFNSTIGSGISVGNVSGNLIQAFIPSDAFLIENSEVIYASTIYGNESNIMQGINWYFDVCPEEYNPYNISKDDSIPGYDLMITLSCLFIVSFYIIRRYRKYKL